MLDEVEHRKKESLGLAATGNPRTLGSAPHSPPSRSGGDTGRAGSNSGAVDGIREHGAESSRAWSCLVCTLWVQYRGATLESYSDPFLPVTMSPDISHVLLVGHPKGNVTGKAITHESTQ